MPVTHESVRPVPNPHIVARWILGEPAISGQFPKLLARHAIRNSRRRMATANQPPLMDKTEFLEALNSLESFPREHANQASAPRETANAAPASPAATRPAMPAAAGPTAPTPRSNIHHRRHGPQFMLPEGAIKPPADAAQSSAPRGLAAIVFVVMMLVGAGAAALVFHDRVAMIVAQFQSTSR